MSYYCTEKLFFEKFDASEQVIKFIKIYRFSTVQIYNWLDEKRFWWKL